MTSLQLYIVIAIVIFIIYDYFVIKTERPQNCVSLIMFTNKKAYLQELQIT